MSDANRQRSIQDMAAVMNQLAAMQTRQSDARDSEQYFTLDYKPPSDQYAGIRQVTVVVTKGNYSGQLTPSGHPLYPYHYRIFLPFSQSNTNSVEMSVHRPFYSTTHGKVVVQSRNCFFSTNNLVSNIHFALVRSCKVNDVVDLIINQKARWKFYFDKTTGSGCANWCRTVINDMEQAGFLSAGTTERYNQFVSNTSASDPEAMPFPDPKGTFY